MKMLNNIRSKLIIDELPPVNSRLDYCFCLHATFWVMILSQVLPHFRDSASGMACQGPCTSPSICPHAAF